MAFRRLSSIAYGAPDVGCLVLGGENDQTFPVYDWKPIADSYGESGVMVEFGIIATDASTFKAARAALKNLRSNSGDLGVAAAADLSFSNLSGVVAGTTLTITDDAAGGQFSDSNLGMPIDIEGVGSYQITGVTSSDVVTCKLPVGLTAPSNFSAKNGQVGHEILRVHHASVTGGYFARTKLVEVPDSQSNIYHRRYRLEITFERSADDGTRDPSGRRFATFAVSQGPAELRVAVFEGFYTPTTASDTSNDTARANYEAGVDTWITTILTALAGSWKPVDRDFSEPDENGTLRFRVRYDERNFPDTASASVNNTLIRNPRVSFTRVHNVNSGHPSIRPVMVRITYSCSVPKGSKTWDQLASVWRDTIKPHLLTSVSTEFGGTVIETGVEQLTPYVTSSALEASMIVIVQGTASNVVSFSKLTLYSLSPRETRDLREEQTGEQHDYQNFGATPIITASVLVSVSRFGSLSDSGIEKLVGPQAPSSDVAGGSSTDGWQVPGSPPYPDSVTNGASPRWNLMAANLQPSIDYLGFDADGRSRRQVISTGVYLTRWIWGRVRQIPRLGSTSSGGSKPPGAAPSGVVSPPRSPGFSSPEVADDVSFLEFDL